jgi:hypothetical protein
MNRTGTHYAAKTSCIAAAVLIRPHETGPFETGVFRAIFRWLGGTETDEGEQVF